ncbi:nitroreductase [Clostridia bacterium]|nr:nitroreductase [Clostridia bacterium]
METLKAITLRKSTRGFKPDALSDKVVETIIKAGAAAPIGHGAFDSVHLTVVTNAELMKKISDAATKGTEREGGNIFYGAPLVVIVSSTKSPVPGLDYANVGCIIENMLVAATDINIANIYIYGTVFGFENAPELLAEAGIPDGYKPISSAAFGLPTVALPTTKSPLGTMGVNFVK